LNFRDNRLFSQDLIDDSLGVVPEMVFAETVLEVAIFVVLFVPIEAFIVAQIHSRPCLDVIHDLE
jgi:hypothetical protein